MTISVEDRSDHTDDAPYRRAKIGDFVTACKHDIEPGDTSYWYHLGATLELSGADGVHHDASHLVLCEACHQEAERLLLADPQTSLGRFVTHFFEMEVELGPDVAGSN